MAEAAAQYIVQFEQAFPRANVKALGAEIMAAGVLAPGLIPPSKGLWRQEAIAGLWLEPELTFRMSALR